MLQLFGQFSECIYLQEGQFLWNWIIQPKQVFKFSIYPTQFEFSIQWRELFMLVIVVTLNWGCSRFVPQKSWGLFFTGNSFPLFNKEFRFSFTQSIYANIINSFLGSSLTHTSGKTYHKLWKTEFTVWCSYVFCNNIKYRQRVLISQVLDETHSAGQREALHSKDRLWVFSTDES